MGAGSAMQQVWGERWGQEQGAIQNQDWLNDMRSAEVAPLDATLQRCMLAPIQERVRSKGFGIPVSTMHLPHAASFMQLLSSPHSQPVHPGRKPARMVCIAGHCFISREQKLAAARIRGD